MEDSWVGYVRKYYPGKEDIYHLTDDEIIFIYQSEFKNKNLLPDEVTTKEDYIQYLKDISHPNYKVIKLTGPEIQSKLDRLQRAESLIIQLPHNHDGANTWLLNYGTGYEATKLREEKGIKWIEETESAETTK